MTRHTGGWIVLGAGLLAACLLGAWRGDPFSQPVGGLSPSAGLRDRGTSQDSGNWQDRARRPAALQPRDRFPRLCIDINQADEAELSCIAGIGPALAHRIVEYRQRVGRFRTMAEVENIPGVGPKLSAQMRSVMQPLAENESDIAVADPARLVGRRIQSPINEPLHD